MRQQINLILTIIICLSFMTVATVTAVAAGDPDFTPDVSESSETSESSTTTDTSSTDSSTNSIVDGESSVSSDKDEVSDGTVGDETSDSSEGTESSDQSDVESDGEESSKPHYIATGSGESKHFDSRVASQGKTSINKDANVNSYIGSVALDTESHFKGETKKAITSIYKVIWIPILLIVICVGALVYVNVFVAKKYKKTKRKSKP